MIGLTRKTGSLVCAVALTLLTMFSSAAVIAGSDRVASFENGSWTSHVAFESVRVTVSGPEGFYWQETFEHAGSLRLPSHRLADGSYTYELRFTAPGTSSRITTETDRPTDNGRNVRPANAGATSAHPILSSGAFRVREGNIVRPDPDEAEE